MSHLYSKDQVSRTSVFRDESFCKNWIPMCNPYPIHGRVFLEGREVTSSEATSSMLQRSFWEMRIGTVALGIFLQMWKKVDEHSWVLLEQWLCGQRSEVFFERRGATLRPREKRGRTLEKLSDFMKTWGFTGISLHFTWKKQKASSATGLGAPGACAQTIISLDWTKLPVSGND